MQNLEMGRIDGVLHRLKPIRIEKRINDYFSCSIVSSPNVIWRYQRSRLRAHVGPVTSAMTASTLESFMELRSLLILSQLFLAVSVERIVNWHFMFEKIVVVAIGKSKAFSNCLEPWALWRQAFLSRLRAADDDR
jgi:hypothetical protein